MDVLVCVTAPLVLVLVASRILRDVRRDWAARDYCGILLSSFVVVSVASMVCALVLGSIEP